jgi:hypothetical protein
MNISSSKKQKFTYKETEVLTDSEDEDDDSQENGPLGPKKARKIAQNVDDDSSDDEVIIKK